jgi:hypothetical protein
MRLNPDLRRRVARIARREGTTASHVMRKAVEAWVEKEENAPTLYDKVKDLIGSAPGGDPHLSQDAGRKVATMLKARYGRS